MALPPRRQDLSRRPAQDFVGVGAQGGFLGIDLDEGGAVEKGALTGRPSDRRGFDPPALRGDAEPRLLSKKLDRPAERLFAVAEIGTETDERSRHRNEGGHPGHDLSRRLSFPTVAAPRILQGCRLVHLAEPIRTCDVGRRTPTKSQKSWADRRMSLLRFKQRDKVRPVPTR